MKWWKNWFTKGRVSMPVDYARLGNELVGLLLASLEDDVSDSAKLLERLARDWQPSADELTIAQEILLFHKFLLVQACAELLSHQSVLDRVSTALYTSLDQVLVEDMVDAGALAELERLWAIRVHQYEEPFAIDLEEYKEHRPGYVPWLRLIGKFMRNFREPSGQWQDRRAILREIPKSLFAIVAIDVTFTLYLEKAYEIITSHFGQKS